MIQLRAEADCVPETRPPNAPRCPRGNWPTFSINFCSNKQAGYEACGGMCDSQGVRRRITTYLALASQEAFTWPQNRKLRCGRTTVELFAAQLLAKSAHSAQKAACWPSPGGWGMGDLPQNMAVEPYIWQLVNLLFSSWDIYLVMTI